MIFNGLSNAELMSGESPIDIMATEHVLVLIMRDFGYFDLSARRVAFLLTVGAVAGVAGGRKDRRQYYDVGVAMVATKACYFQDGN